MKHLCPLLLLATLASLQYAHAKIVRSRVIQDDRPYIELSEAFAFSPGGQVVLTIRNVTLFKQHVDSPQPNTNRMGMFLSSIEETGLEEDGFITDCILDDASSSGILYSAILIRFDDSEVRKVTGSRRTSDKAGPFLFTMGTSSLPAGQFILYFTNCERSPVSFDVVVEMYNVDSSGKKDYLSAGETELQTVFWVMFGVFLAATFIWCGFAWKNREHAQRIHYLMAALGIAKAVTLMSQAVMLHHISLTGSADGWNIAFYVFTFLKGLLFFTVIVLIGTGWSYMKPFLGDRDKRILMVVIPLQVFANMAAVIIDEESPAVQDWFTWQDIFHLVDIICCCAILFPIMWSIQSLREASQTDGKAARNLEKLTLFRQLYILLVMYIYFTRIIVYLLTSTLPYQYAWLGELAGELSTLAFFVWIGVNFRPHQQNPYLRLQSEDAEIQMESRGS